MAFKSDKQRKAAFYYMNRGRTQQAINSDVGKRASDTRPNTPENVKEWKNNPRRIDIEGIDTPFKIIVDTTDKAWKEHDAEMARREDAKIISAEEERLKTERERDDKSIEDNIDLGHSPAEIRAGFGEDVDNEWLQHQIELGKREDEKTLSEDERLRLEKEHEEFIERGDYEEILYPWHEKAYEEKYKPIPTDWIQHQVDVRNREEAIEKALEGEHVGDMPSIGDKIALQSGADGKLISISDTHMEIEQKARAGDSLKTEILKVPLKDTMFVKRKDSDKWDLKIDYGEPRTTKQIDKSTTSFKVDPTLINKDLAMRAHHGTSFDPELRGKQEIESFEIEMDKAYKTLSKQAKTPEQKAILNEEMQKYQENYAKKQNELLSSKSRIISPMITGPANFPTRRNQKANDAYHNKYGQFMEWESKALGSISRKIERHEKQKQIVSAGGEVALMKQKIQKLETHQEDMKRANKIIRKKIPENERVEQLEDVGIKAGMGKLLIETGGYETYQLTNNNANIKRMKDRVIDMEKMEDKPSSTVKFPGGEIIDNNQADRVQIFFEEKPDEAMRTKLKGSGWRWSPSNGTWQRKRTNAALYSAQQITGDPI